MQIKITKYNILINKMDYADLKLLVNKYLGINFDSFVQKTVNNSLIYEYAVEGVKMVKINTKDNIIDNDCDVLLDLNLKCMPNCDLNKLHKYVNRFGIKVNQVDILYVDDLHHLSVNAIEDWFKHDNSIGCLVKYCAPRFVRKEGELHRVKLESKESTANYGYICMQSKSGSIEFKIRVKKKEKIQYVLSELGDAKQLEVQCLRLLVSLIDFITSESKKARIKSKYVRQPLYESFLEQQAVKPVNWSSLINESV